MKVLNDFAPIPMAASEVAHWLLTPASSVPARYELHLPSSEELLSEVLKRPEHFVTKGKFDASGVFVVDHGDRVVAVEQSRYAGIIERREFSSLQQCFETLLPLFRRFLKTEFNFFVLSMIGDPGLFPKHWRYTPELTLGTLQKSLQSPDAFHSSPTRSHPPLADVIALLLPHESKLLNQGYSDGPHLVKTKKGYAFRWYERGQIYDDTEYSRFEDALRKYLEGFIRPASLEPRDRFSRLNALENSWTEGEPPV